MPNYWPNLVYIQPSYWVQTNGPDEDWCNILPFNTADLARIVREAVRLDSGTAVRIIDHNGVVIP